MLPTLFHIGPWPVRTYGTLLVIGFLLCLWRTSRVAERRMRTEPEDSPRRIHPDQVFDVGLYGLMIGLVGARLMFVALSWGPFSKDPLSALRIWEGGLSLHGGMLAGSLFLFWYCRRHGIVALALADLGASAWALAYSFGRVGCFLNGCCYGAVCERPWGVRFRDEHAPGLLTPPSHPVQLYGTLLNLFFFYLLTRWERRPHRDGELFCGYMAMYGGYRFAAEYFRAGTTSTFLVPALQLTLTHVVSLVMVAGGLLGVAWLRRTRPAYRDAAFDAPREAPPAAAPTTAS